MVSKQRLFDRPVALSIGPQRCGTEWLHDYLKSREDICLLDVKEIFYFDRLFQRGPEFYVSHFKPNDKHSLIMELTTTAFDNSDAPSHVHELFGKDVRLICPLRDPVERSKEVYADCLKYGLVHGGIEEAVERIPQILFSSRYSDHLRRWREMFGPDSVEIVFYETLEQDALQFATHICKALDIPFEAPHKQGMWSKFTGSTFKKRDILPEIHPKDVEWLKNRLNHEVSLYQNLPKNR